MGWVSDRERFAPILRESGMTNHEISQAAGVSPATVKRFATDGKSLRPATVGKVAKALGCKTTEIARFVDDQGAEW